MRHGTTWTALVLALALAPSARAQSAGSGMGASFNAFGNVGYGISDVRRYNLASPGGGYRANFGVSFAGRPTDDILVTLQPYMEFDGETSTLRINFVQARWTFSDLLTLNLGKGRLPFGIYTEIFDVGVLRPFLPLPMGMYGRSGPIGLSYVGAGASGSYFFGGDWGVSYDVFFGDLQVPSAVTLPRAGSPMPSVDPSAVAEFEQVRNTVGGRLNVLTALDGLRFGASAYRGETASSDKARNVVGGHIEYKGDALEARAEYSQLKQDTTIDAYYAEASYRFLEIFQAAVRYDSAEETLDAADAVGINEEFLKHHELAFAFNLWHGPSFVTKLSYHRVDGLRLSRPLSKSRMQQIVASASPSFTGEAPDIPTQQLIMVGTSFSF